MVNCFTAITKTTLLNVGKNQVFNCFTAITKTILLDASSIAFVKIICSWVYHVKIFILRGIFNFPINSLVKGVPWFIKY